MVQEAGRAVKADEPLVELETDKVTVEVPAPVRGVLAEIKVAQGTTVAVGGVLGAIKEGAGAPAQPAAKAAAKPAPAAPKPAPAAANGSGQGRHAARPAARKKMAEEGLAAADVRAPAAAARC